jgi:hypothetical protein
MNIWKSVFTKSQVNESYYDENCLPDLHWEWPKGTWFQTRLDYARDQASVGRLKASRKLAELDIAWSDCKSADATKAPEETAVTSAAVPQQQDRTLVADATRNSRGKGSPVRHRRQKRSTKASPRKKASQPPMCAS